MDCFLLSRCIDDGIVLQGSCNIEYYLNQRRLLRISSNHQSFLQKLVRGHGLIVCSHCPIDE